jgi:hypothetical protein
MKQSRWGTGTLRGKQQGQDIPQLDGCGKPKLCHRIQGLQALPRDICFATLVGSECVQFRAFNASDHWTEVVLQ